MNTIKRHKFFSVLLLIGVFLLIGFVFETQISGNLFRKRNLRPDPVLLKKAMEGDDVAVREMLAKNVDPNTPPGNDNKGMTALMFASWNGHADTVRLLIRAGAKIDAVSDSGATALMFAAQEGHDSTVLALLNHGNADPDIQSPNGETALSIAISGGKTSTALLLASHGKARDLATPKNLSTPLMRAISKQDIEVINALLNLKLDLEARDKRGRTALVYAVERGNSEIVSLLLSKGADSKTVDNNGLSVSRFAQLLGQDAIAQSLQNNN